MYSNSVTVDVEVLPVKMMPSNNNDDGNEIPLDELCSKMHLQPNRTNLFKYEFLFSIKNHSVDADTAAQTNNATSCS